VGISAWFKKYSHHCLRTSLSAETDPKLRNNSGINKGTTKAKQSFQFTKKMRGKDETSACRNEIVLDSFGGGILAFEGTATLTHRW
jgi:hypothetical protein